MKQIPTFKKKKEIKLKVNKDMDTKMGQSL